MPYISGRCKCKQFQIKKNKEDFMKKVKSFDSNMIPPWWTSLKQKNICTIYVNSMWLRATDPDCIKLNSENCGWFVNGIWNQHWRPVTTNIILWNLTLMMTLQVYLMIINFWIYTSIPHWYFTVLFYYNKAIFSLYYYLFISISTFWNLFPSHVL